MANPAIASTAPATAPGNAPQALFPILALAQTEFVEAKALGRAIFDSLLGSKKAEFTGKKEFITANERGRALAEIVRSQAKFTLLEGPAKQFQCNANWTVKGVDIDIVAKMFIHRFSIGGGIAADDYCRLTVVIADERQYWTQGAGTGTETLPASGPNATKPFNTGGNSYMKYNQVAVFEDWDAKSTGFTTNLPSECAGFNVSCIDLPFEGHRHSQGHAVHDPHDVWPGEGAPYGERRSGERRRYAPPCLQVWNGHPPRPARRTTHRTPSGRHRAAGQTAEYVD
jgi:hypothetical protein